MSNRFEDLVILTLTSLKEDIKGVDGKTDENLKVLIKLTAVVEEHERRSTPSETRIETLEKKEQDRADKALKLKGFLVYGSATIGAFLTLLTIFLNLTEILKFFL